MCVCVCVCQVFVRGGPGVGVAGSVLSAARPEAQLCLPRPLRCRRTVHPLPVVCPTAQLPGPTGEHTPHTWMCFGAAGPWGSNQTGPTLGS